WPGKPTYRPAHVRSAWTTGRRAWSAPWPNFLPARPDSARQAAEADTGGAMGDRVQALADAGSGRILAQLFDEAGQGTRDLGSILAGAGRLRHVLKQVL